MGPNLTEYNAKWDDNVANILPKQGLVDEAQIDAKFGREIMDLFRDYSDIPEEEIRDHVKKLVARASAVFPFATITQYRFLTLWLRAHPAYPKILESLKSDPERKFMDMGCCLGQDLRGLRADGVPGEQLVGVDLSPEFEDVGYDLFKDKEKFNATFFAANLIPTTAEEKGGLQIVLERLERKVDVIWASAFMHCFSRDERQEVIRIVIKLLRDSPGSMFIGQHIGSVKSGDYDMFGNGTMMWRDDPDSWREVWGEIGVETNTAWDVDAVVDQVEFGAANNKGQLFADDDCRRILFTVTRK